MNRVIVILSLTLALGGQPQIAQERPPAEDARASLVRDLNTPCVFQPYRTREEWRERAADLRRQILMSAGLWPTPAKTPLNATIFGKIERGDYSIEKVYFESYPGFLVTGNLYRPLGKTGPFPAILSPHGHWYYGRLENSELGSIPARCISFARQGYVVFAYDMVGYNDSIQVNHRLMSKPLSLWGISSLGLHLWNSIRSVDFVEGLSDVDKNRLACTGASGGGTQTFLLTAVDDRIKVSAPVNMISHYMQGGDACENAPNLRLDTNNMEFGALMAPRPLLLVSAAGDWTRDTPRIEFPAIQSVYRLLDAKDKVATEQFVSEHNYHLQSREAVYRWFGHWILNQNDQSQLQERSFEMDMPSTLLVFFGRTLPQNAVNENQLTQYLIQIAKQQVEALKPARREDLDTRRDQMRTALQLALAAEFPRPDSILSSASPPHKVDAPSQFFIGRKDRGDRVPASLWSPSHRGSPKATLIVHPEGIDGANRDAPSLIIALSKKKHVVLSIDAFNTGNARASRNTSDRFFTTYNRTDDANRIQDILTAIAYLKSQPGIQKINVIGLGKAGLWVLLARSLTKDVESIVADVGNFRSDDDQAYLEQLYIPLIRRAGDFKSALALCAPSRLLLHNCVNDFKTEWASLVYGLTQSTEALRIEPSQLSPDELGKWIN